MELDKSGTFASLLPNLSQFHFTSVFSILPHFCYCECPLYYSRETKAHSVATGLASSQFRPGSSQILEALHIRGIHISESEKQK